MDGLHDIVVDTNGLVIQALALISFDFSDWRFAVAELDEPRGLLGILDGRNWEHCR